MVMLRENTRSKGSTKEVWFERHLTEHTVEGDRGIRNANHRDRHGNLRNNVLRQHQERGKHCMAHISHLCTVRAAHGVRRKAWWGAYQVQGLTGALLLCPRLLRRPMRSRPEGCSAAAAAAAAASCRKSAQLLRRKRLLPAAAHALLTAPLLQAAHLSERNLPQRCKLSTEDAVAGATMSTRHCAGAVCCPRTRSCTSNAATDLFPALQRV